MSEPTEDATELMPAEVAAGVPPLYAQDGKGGDATVYVKLFTPWTSWTWFVTEYDPAERIAFGLAVGPVAELGYFALEELEGVRGPAGLRIERDLWFTPRPMADVRAQLRRDGYPS
jgi:Protein of unknown function (DUF2958)